MKAAVLVSAIAVLSCLPAARSHAQSPPATPTLNVTSSLTLIDVIAENKKTGRREALTDLKREDLRLWDNGHETPITSFDSGAKHATRAIALWLIVQCNDAQPPGHHSMFMHGRTDLLKPALAHLGADDAIGVAHWCDRGDAQIDLSLSRDSGETLAKVEEILSEKPTSSTETRPGELAMQRMIRLLLQDTNETFPQREPILLFLHGDRCGTHADEANSIATDLHESSAIVYGMNDGASGSLYGVNDILSPFDSRKANPKVDIAPREGMTRQLVHYYSRETGGEVYSTSPKSFSDTLDHMLLQLQLRYTIGFRPLKLDGKRHLLRVELTREAHKRYPAAVLRFRTEYVAATSP